MSASALDDKTSSRIVSLARSLGTADDPVDRLRAAKQLRELIEDVERACGHAAHDAGVSWSEIGEVYGSTKQAAARRFGSRA